MATAKTFDTKDLLRELHAQNFEVEKTSQGHYRVRPPDPQYPIVHFGASGDPRGIKNTISQLRRSGFVPPWEEFEEKEQDMETKQELDLDALLDGFNEVTNQQASQLVFTREVRGKWLLTIPEEYVMADGAHGKGATPIESCNQVMADLRGQIRERIKQLQELEQRLAS